MWGDGCWRLGVESGYGEAKTRGVLIDKSTTFKVAWKYGFFEAAKRAYNTEEVGGS